VNITEFFIRRPVATILLTIGIALTGIASYFSMPVAALPSVDFPTVAVSANLPGASPQVMATSVATPLERRLGQIADVTEMTSQSQTGQTRVILQFGLNRDIDGAARDVQAAINAARQDLPATLRSNPSYRKINPADSPILQLNLLSDTLTMSQVYDAAATVLQQKLSQVSGVGEVSIGGAASPAVRVELNPRALSQYGITSEDIRAAIAASNANLPKGQIQAGGRRMQIYTNDAGQHASDYAKLVIAYRDGSAVRLQDVATVSDGPENLFNMGITMGKPSLVVQITRQPGANIIGTAERVKALLPELQAELPPQIRLEVSSDRTVTIRASLKEVERTLLIAVALVVLVVLVFLRNVKATLIPAVAVVVSLLGTLSVMYACGFSLDNISLMALTVATGFVVDDAIVVLENITRHVENGMGRFQAALVGAREVGFTVISMSISLIAVFIPILMMGGVMGLLFREFAVSLAAAVAISLVVSLTCTPMMAARLVQKPARLQAPKAERHGFVASLFDGFAKTWDRQFGRFMRSYEEALDWSLAHKRIVLASLFAVIGLNFYLYAIVPKGFFPQQDTGMLQGFVQVDQASSFDLTSEKYKRMLAIVQADPAVARVGGFIQGAGGQMFVTLKPLKERKISSDEVTQRLRPKLSQEPGAQLFLQTVQDIRIGGRQSNAQYQYTLESDNIDDLRVWTTKLADELKKVPELTDVNTDQQERGLETFLTVDRETASRLGITSQAVNNALYNAFGQRQVSTIYNDVNQYHVIMEADPKYAQSPSALDEIYVSPAANRAAAGQLRTTTGGGGANQAQTGNAVSTTVANVVPLSAIASYSLANTSRQVNHQGQAVAATISFNLQEGAALSDAQDIVKQAQARIGLPINVVGKFRGTAQAFQQSLKDQPMLILAALVAVYLVLGVLYESYIHPITVLSTLPSAGVGAVLALLLFKIEFSIIALIGVILLIGIVKKNAIMMIDFALTAEREEGLGPAEAIRKAALLRFRPIMMTTAAALLGALPLALGIGEGGELRRPLGVAIIGGLMVSQMLTLLTTPVVYVYMDRLRGRRRKDRPAPGYGGAPAVLGPAAAPKE
jgi:multidrug efflux pump